MNAPAAAAHDAVDDRQAEAGPLVHLLGGEVGLEDALASGGVHPATVVAYGEPDIVAGGDSGLRGLRGAGNGKGLERDIEQTCLLVAQRNANSGFSCRYSRRSVTPVARTSSMRRFTSEPSSSHRPTGIWSNRARCRRSLMRSASSARRRAVSCSKWSATTSSCVLRRSRSGRSLLSPSASTPSTPSRDFIGMHRTVLKPRALAMSVAGSVT